MCPVDLRKAPYFVVSRKAVPSRGVIIDNNGVRLQYPAPSDAQDNTSQYEVDELIRQVAVDARASVEWRDCDERFDEEAARCLAAAILEAAHDGVYYDLGVSLDIGERRESMAVAVAVIILNGRCCSDKVRRNAHEVLERCPNRWVVGPEMFGHNFASICSPLED